MPSEGSQHDDDGVAITVGIDDLETFLTADDPTIREYAAGRLLEVAGDDPGEVRSLAPTMLDRLDADGDAVREDVAESAALVAEAHPSAFADEVQALSGHAADDRPAVRGGVARALAAVAEHDPDAATDAVDALADRLDDDRSAYAVDAAGGGERWRVDVGDGVRAPPAVADDTLLVADGDGTVHGLATADGARRWTVDTDADPRTLSVASGAIALGDAERGWAESLSRVKKMFGG
jgi:hypothetical protein